MQPSFRTPRETALFDQQWQRLETIADTYRQNSILEYFESEPERLEAMTINCDGMRLDYSRSAMSREVRQALLDLLETSGLDGARASMFSGDELNNTEHRAVMHCALRSRNAIHNSVDADSASDDPQRLVADALDDMEAIVDRLHSGEWTGFGGESITDVVSIGIGGSFLGPAVVVSALRPDWHDRIRVHFVANVDAADVLNTLETLDASRTVFIIQSKTFTTQETLANAMAARAWLLSDPRLAERDDAEAELARHFMAVTANEQGAAEFGIDPTNLLPMWDWVGGRYSLWSAIGLPIACQIGMPLFRRLLEGASSMDEHFLHAPAAENMPVMLALTGVWHSNFRGIGNNAVIPYDQGLGDLAAHLQQVDMESNGKSVQRDGSPAFSQTGTIVWGGAGTNGQHAYHQLIHQGTRVVPVDFILPLKARTRERKMASRVGLEQLQAQHRMLVSNCLAQSRAMLAGKSLQQATAECLDAGMSEAEAAALAPHKVIAGNKPSTTITVDQVDAFSVGQLIALYEQRIFVQGVIWNLNSFDQWGVELGKQMCSSIMPMLDGSQSADSSGLDPSTAALVAAVKRANS